jgi:hypothetical protein
MKIISVLRIVLLFAVTNSIYSQVSGTKKESEKKQEEKVVQRPSVYDSTKTLEEQYTVENQYQYIGLKLFIPPVISPEDGPLVFSKDGSGFERGNRYYTIIDILKGDAVMQLKQKKVINLCGYQYKDLNSPLWKELVVHVIFVLRDNSKSDSLIAPLYWVVCESKAAPYSSSYFNSFVSVPYFEKQKQLFENQDVINLSDKSKWLCNEVTLLRSKDDTGQDSTYNVFCWLVNENSKRIQRRPPSEKYGRTFITEKEYIRLDHANRNQKEELLKAENDRKEKYKAECISKFGQQKGELITQGKIEVGMTSEMCKVAWGAPWDISKKAIPSGIKEIWFYNWKYNLHFEKGVLVNIEH